MKQRITLFTILVCILFVLTDAHSGLIGDVDNNGKIGLNEVVNALQVTSGLRSAIETSYVIVLKGAWVGGQSYQTYDAVQLNGSSYICLQNHTSDESNQPPSAPQWEPLSLKGEKGDTGPQGPQGEPGPLNPNVNVDTHNTALGYQVLYSNTTGVGNTIILPKNWTEI